MDIRQGVFEKLKQRTEEKRKKLQECYVTYGPYILTA
jgi:hypothetical protein